MAVITISRGSYSMGKMVAEQVAEKLGYHVISRDLLLEASERFNIPEIKLTRAIHDAPSILERFRHGKQSYNAYIRAALAERICDDDVVYHGLAGHLLLKEIPGVLKVRITSDLQRRIANEMKREGIDAQTATEIIRKDDQQRRKWTKNLHGVDPWDSNLYDLVIRIDTLTVDNAVEFICRASESEVFRSTQQSLQKLKDFALACRIKAELVEDFPNAGVTCQYGNIIVYARDKDLVKAKLATKIEMIRKHISGIHNLEIHAQDPIPKEAV